MPPLASSAHTMRAVLLANGPATSIRGFLASIWASHEPAGAPRMSACLITALAPSSLRKVAHPSW